MQPAQSQFKKRAAEGLDIEVHVSADKLGDDFPTAATAAATGLTFTTGAPTADGAQFTVTGGTSGTYYTATATFTLSDGRTVVELFEVYVYDETVTADPTVAIDNYPPSVYLTNRASVEVLLSKMSVALKLDRDQDGNVNPLERQEIARGAAVATDWVKMHCTTYADEDIVKSPSAWNWATIYFARWLCLREGNPIPPGLYELYAEAEKHLREIQHGSKFLADIDARLDPEPSWSNLRMDRVYANTPQRVQKQTSDQTQAGFRRKQDTLDKYLRDVDL